MKVNANWNEKPVKLKFLLGEIPLFSVRLSMLTLDSHFTELLGNGEQAAMSMEQVPSTADGFLVRSLPAGESLPRLRVLPDSLQYVPAQYQRFYLEMQPSFAEYLRKFSPKSRHTLRRKVRKFAEFSGGHVDWREYRSSEDMQEFYRLARQVSTLTYQERLLKAGLPESEDFQRTVVTLASRGLARGYLLYYHGRAISYMFCTLSGLDILLYRYVGFDPKFQSWSPGTVLFYLAVEKLFAQREFRILDFTEGEGDQKRFFATGSIRCADVYHFRRSGRILFLIVLHFVADFVSRATVRVLDGLNLRARVKKFLRSRA